MIRKSFVLGALAAFCFQAFAALPPIRPLADFAGIVTDSISGDPIQGAKVMLTRVRSSGRNVLSTEKVDSVNTSSTGSYSFSLGGIIRIDPPVLLKSAAPPILLIVDTTYTLSVSSDGYTSKTASGLVDGATVVVTNFALVPTELPDFAGHVSDGATGAKIAGAKVILYSYDPALIISQRTKLDSCVTDAHGYYKLNRPRLILLKTAATAYRVTATMAGYVTEGVGGLQPAAAPVITDLVMTPDPAVIELAPMRTTMTSGSALRMAGSQLVLDLNQAGVVSLFAANGRTVLTARANAGRSSINVPATATIAQVKSGHETTVRSIVR